MSISTLLNFYSLPFDVLPYGENEHFRDFDSAVTDEAELMPDVVLSSQAGKQYPPPTTNYQPATSNHHNHEHRMNVRNNLTQGLNLAFMDVIPYGSYGEHGICEEQPAFYRWLKQGVDNHCEGSKEKLQINWEFGTDIDEIDGEFEDFHFLEFDDEEVAVVDERHRDVTDAAQHIGHALRIMADDFQTSVNNKRRSSSKPGSRAKIPSVALVTASCFVAWRLLSSKT